MLQKLMERQCSERYRWSGSPHSVSRNRKKVCLFPLLKFWSPRYDRRSCTSGKIRAYQRHSGFMQESNLQARYEGIEKVVACPHGKTGAASEKKLEACVMLSDRPLTGKGVEEFTEDKKGDNNTEVSSIVTRIMMLLTELLSYDDAYTLNTGKKTSRRNEPQVLLQLSNDLVTSHPP
eukprot:gene18567-37549_t